MTVNNGINEEVCFSQDLVLSLPLWRLESPREALLSSQVLFFAPSMYADILAMSIKRYILCIVFASELSFLSRRCQFFLN